MTLQYKRISRHPIALLHIQITEQSLQIVLDPLVNRAQMLSKEPILLRDALQKRTPDLEKGIVFLIPKNGVPLRSEFDI